MVSTCFSRLPIGIYCLSRAEKESGIDGSTPSVPIIQDLIENGGIDPERVRNHLDRPLERSLAQSIIEAELFEKCAEEGDPAFYREMQKQVKPGMKLGRVGFEKEASNL